MFDKIKVRLNFILKKISTSLVFPFIAIIIAFFSLLYTKYIYDDQKINTEIWINLNKCKNIQEYENRIEFVFRNISNNIINMFKREKGILFINENNDLIEYIFLTKVIYDLTNDSYEQFFTRINILDVYNNVGRAINIYDVKYLSNILWNTNNLDDISYNILEEIIENIIINDIQIKKNKLNTLLEEIKKEKYLELEKLEKNYYNTLLKNNLEKELIEEYYRLNDSYHGLTLAQKDWFNQRDNEKINIIDSYINTYLSSILFKYFLEELRIRGENE